MPAIMSTGLANLSSRHMTVRGFTLLEVMISLVVLAIGVMGVIGLQTATYQQLQTSQNFSKAAMLAGDMADRMLANQENVPSTAYLHPHDAAIATPDPDCTTAACNPAQLAAYDVWHWQTELRGLEADNSKIPGSLPDASGEVLQTAAGDYVILVRWDDDLSASTGTDCVALNPLADQDSDDLECYVLNLGCLDSLGVACP